MKLHVLTAITRPGNVPVLAQLLAHSATDTDVEVVWHWSFDPERTDLGGHAQKNRMLDEIADGWVWMLDDDTTVHENLIRRIAETVAEHPDADAVVVSQKRLEGFVLRAHPDNVREGAIDAGQAVLRRDLIGDDRQPLRQGGDGVYLESVLARANAVFLDEVLSYHNALEQRGVS